MICGQTPQASSAWATATAAALMGMECVVFMGEDSVSVVVAAPETGLNTADVARIKDIVVNETDYTPEQIKIMEAN